MSWGLDFIESTKYAGRKHISSSPKQVNNNTDLQLESLELKDVGNPSMICLTSIGNNKCETETIEPMWFISCCAYS